MEPNGRTPHLDLGPVPVSTVVQLSDTPEGKRVVLIVTTPQGVQGFFLSADHAAQLSDHLAQAGRSAKSGIEIVGPGSMLPPPANPLGN